MMDTAAVEAPRGGTLVLCCRKCTREGRFSGATKLEAIHTARQRGWVMPEPGVFVCPKCPAARNPHARR